ncbi:MAG TPA: VWA domain-containing protein, partial [Methylomirabilota bacterium]
MRLFISLLVLGFTTGTVAPAAAQSSERSVYVSVLDEDGAPVTGLPADRFRVTEDGQTREVLRADRTTDRLDLAIIVDNSTASQPHIQDLRKGLTQFVKRMANAGHSIALIGMADRPTILADYTTSESALEKAVTRLFAQPGSGTVFQDAITEVSQGMARREAPRRAILVITTEGTDFSNVPYQRTLEALRGSGAALHTMVFS